MPPRGQFRGGRGSGRGGRGGGAAPAPAPAMQAPAAHITTVGVRRPGFGTSGRPLTVNINAYPATIPEGNIYQYDVVISPGDNAPALNTKLINQLQKVVAPQIFSAALAVYDGRKIMYSAVALRLGSGNSAEFDVPLPGGSPERPPKVFKIRLTLAATINTEVVRRFTEGKQSQDNIINSTLMALNVVIKMDPSLKFPTKGRSFFTPEGAKPIGSGLVLWRGYFQSIRPAIGRILVNVDISSGVMYQPGPLLKLCLAYLKIDNPAQLNANMPDRIRVKLRRWITGIRVMTKTASGGESPHARPIKDLSKLGADQITFQNREGQVTNVARYFESVSNQRLQFPGGLCVQLGRDAWVPLELCRVLPGQIVRKELPEEERAALVDFSTKRPKERLESIQKGLQVLAYGQSEYVRKFGLSIDPTLITTQARVLRPPTLKYGGTGPGATVNPNFGSWNMADKKFIQPATVEAWVLVILDNRFQDGVAQDVIRDLNKGLRDVGMTVKDPAPIVRRANGQGNIPQQLLQAGSECFNTKKVAPTLFVVILPEGGNDLYTIVKHWGDVRQGVATQCLKSRKCTRAKAQYWANVSLKINVKLGGRNSIIDPSQMPILSDPHQPTIVLGADVMHPPPGATDRPSYASVVSSVDPNAVRYIATQAVQSAKQELITDLQPMISYLLKIMREIKQMPAPPKRLIFFRDGVSEGQFQQVLDAELPLIKAACAEHKINPAITLIVVGKRHHIRMFPTNDRDADKSGNCPAGTVVDRDIAHPTEFDFYLQSHGGLLGTSRPAHYSVLYDENNFPVDTLQALSFALCHVYARATRSVSIPAPVYYADIVCSRAKIHFDPFAQGSTDAATATSGGSDAALEAFKKDYMPLNSKLAKLMYFS